MREKKWSTEQQSAGENKGGISLKQQFMYAFQEIGSNPIYTITLSFLTFFYTDVLGINAGIVGVIILISKFMDGISDIWAGNLIDHTHTKQGSARPWILRSALLLALAYVFLFTVPNVALVGKIIYIFISYNFAMTIAFTLLNAAVNALPIYMTDDSKSRSSAYSIRMIFAGLVQAIFSLVFLNIVKAMGDDQAAWIKVSVFLGIISFFACLVTYFGTHEKNEDVKNREDGNEAEDVPLRTALSSLMHNKYWFMVLGIVVIIVFHQVATLTVGVYYAKYILFDTTLAGSLILYHHAGGAVGMLAMPALLQKGISKKKAAVFGGILMVIGSVIAIINCKGAFLIISLAMRGCGFGIVNGVYYGMLADTVDYGEWKTGVRTLAVNTSVGTVGQKLGSGIGTAIIGFALSACGYNGLAKTQSAAAIGCIKSIFIVMPLILYILLLVLLHFYKLDDELPKIREELEREHRK
jgi:GPH family glycoside/pentoside/hexuronide:cation symporter